MSDLTVIGYPDEQTAARAWDQQVRLEKDCLADLEDAAIIRRDSNGGLHVTTPAHYAVAGAGACKRAARLDMRGAPRTRDVTARERDLA
jgi:uncharacterized membrane protein